MLGYLNDSILQGKTTVNSYKKPCSSPCNFERNQLLNFRKKIIVNNVKKYKYETIIENCYLEL